MSIELKRMTPSRAAYFMERFKRDEKLIGPNEQAALTYVIDMLEKATAIQQAESPQPATSDLRIGVCITDGVLHATVMQHESNGSITVVATAEIDAASLHWRDCIGRMKPATGEPVKAERDQLRCAQADAVMPLIGPLLDAWENADREVMSQEPELSKQLKNINSAMEDAQPATPEPDEWKLVPIVPTEKMLLAYTGGAVTNAGFRWCEHQWSAMLAAAPATHPAPSEPGDVVLKAKRYEWLKARNNTAQIGVGRWESDDHFTWLCDLDADAAIDAAMLSAKDSK